MDKFDPKTWENVPTGSIVTLTDAKTLMDHGVSGRQYTVVSLTRIPEFNGKCFYYFYELEDARDEASVFLLAKVVDRHFTLRVFHKPDDFESGTRQDLIDERDMKWLWLEPENDDFCYDDLAFTERFEFGGNVYVKQHEEDCCGTPETTPRPSGDTIPQLSCIAEYVAEEDETEYPNVLILDTGPAPPPSDDDEFEGEPSWTVEDGESYVEMYRGVTIETGDIDLLKR